MTSGRYVRGAIPDVTALAVEDIVAGGRFDLTDAVAEADGLYLVASGTRVSVEAGETIRARKLFDTEADWILVSLSGDTLKPVAEWFGEITEDHFLI